MGHTSRSMEDSGAKSYLNYGGWGADSRGFSGEEI